MSRRPLRTCDSNLLMGSIPDRLYRYRPPTRYTLENLQKRRFWFSKPKNFNDPFDCAIRVDRNDIPDEEFWRLFRYFQEEKGDQAVQHFLRDGDLTEGFKEKARRGTRNAYKRQVSTILSERGAVCLSAVPPDDRDSILQWSHYAEGHKGFCLEFDTNFSLFGEEGEVFEVEYSNSVPSLNPFDIIIDDADLLTPMIATKADCWAYEQEWRLFHKEGDKAYSYPPECLAAVYLGCEAEDDFRQEVRSIVRNSSTDLYEVERDQRRFELHIEPFDTE